MVGSARPAVMTGAGKRGFYSTLLAAVLLAGCTGTPSGSASSAPPTSTADPIGGQLPPGCEPIDLRGPDGQPEPGAC